MIKFGKKCDVCGIEHNDYSVEDIAYCVSCESDLCDKCANMLVIHRIISDWDVDSQRERSCERERSCI